MWRCWILVSSSASLTGSGTRLGESSLGRDVASMVNSPVGVRTALPEIAVIIVSHDGKCSLEGLGASTYK